MEVVKIDGSRSKYMVPEGNQLCYRRCMQDGASRWNLTGASGSVRKVIGVSSKYRLCN